MSSPLLVHRLPDGVSEEFERSCETMGRSGSRRNFARWLAAGWLQSYLIFLLTNMGNLWAPRPTVARYFLSETGCKLGNLHRVHGSRKLFTCSYLFVVDGESERIEFFFFGIVLSLARSMERRVFFRQFCVTGIFINFYSSRIFQIFREFLRDYVYVYIYIFVCVYVWKDWIILLCFKRKVSF